MSNIVNVGSIEEDIKILKNMIEEYENCSVPEIDMQVDVTFGKKEVNAIKTVLGNLEVLCDMQMSADRELESARRINEEHQKINGELREKVKELEEKNEHLSNTSDYETISLECIHLEEQLEIEKSRIQELEEENASKQKAYDECYCEYKHYKQFESIPKQVVIDLIKNETIDISGFECIAVEDLQELLEGESK